MAPKSVIWQYFTRDNCNALCTVCGKCFLNLNTTNLWSHLQAKHLKEFLELRSNEESIPKFCHDLYIKEKSHVEMATLLDPRFKSGRRNDLDAVLAMEINGIIESRESGSNQTAKVNDEEDTPKTAALQELFADDDLCSVESAEEEINLFHSEIKIKITDCPLKWWKARSSMFPNISVVAKKYLCMPATSVLSERIFNDGKEIMTDNRFRLTDEHMEQLVFLSMNSEYVPLK